MPDGRPVAGVGPAPLLLVSHGEAAASDRAGPRRWFGYATCAGGAVASPSQRAGWTNCVALRTIMCTATGGRTASGGGTVAPTSTRGGGLVLIVEDDEDSRFVYRAILENQGFTVVLATSGDEGLRIARERRPDAILMDVSIPGMDGWTATQRLKEDPDTSAIPVIVITAHAFPEDRHRAVTVGSDGFLTKPCEPRDVLAEIERQIRAAEA